MAESDDERVRQNVEFFGHTRSERVVSYEGFSTYNDNSEVASFHEAVKEAAIQAANEASGNNIQLPAWFEVTRVRILVGNPSLKVYGATITKADAPSSDPE